jgi:hypothetical protein
MQEFAQSSGIFARWGNDEQRRRSLLADLYGIIQSHVYRKFGTAVVSAELGAVLTVEEQEAFNLAAYGIAGRGVVDNVMQWTSAERLELPEFVFEDGDLNKGHLMALMKADGIPAPSFKPKRDTPTRHGLIIAGFLPLQAADILAYEYRLLLEREAGAKDRWGYKQFDKMPGEIRKYSLDNLQTIKAIRVAGELL